MANKDSLPNFLCIGAQKAGTTWLHSVLKQHPGVWLPDRKEIHYFDFKYPPYQPYPDIGWCSEATTQNKAIAPSKSVSKLQRLKKYNIKRFLWELHYRYAARNDNWYARLFSASNGKVSGDFTPAYAILDKQAVSSVSHLIPNAKIIFIMRDPIERAWSHAKMIIGKRGSREISTIADQEFIEFLAGEPSLRRGRYSDAINLWSHYYGNESFLALYFDDILNKPDVLIESVLSFLNLGSMPNEMAHSIHKVVHQGQKLDIPDSVFLKLFDLYENEMKNLAENFSGQAEQWYLNATQKKNEIVNCKGT